MPKPLSVSGLAADLWEARYLTDDPVEWARVRASIHLWSIQREVAQSVVQNRRTAVHAAHGVGKALALNTPLPTPDGWTTMGEVQLGDKLLDEEGKPCTVVATSPVWYRPAHRLTFCDDSELVASGEHEWQVLDLNDRSRRNIGPDWRNHWALTKSRTTEELASSVKTRSGQSRWRIPCARPIQGERIHFPAYTLGAWLGDGTAVAGAITISHEDTPNLLAQIEADGFTCRDVPSAHRETTAYYRVLGLQKWLRANGVLGNKHIPQWALRASREERLALLQGLMDTDGCVHQGRLVAFEVMSERLADDVAELVCSLGWKVHRSTKRAMLDGRDCGTVYRLHFSPSEPVFRLPRKVHAWQPGTTQASRHTQRTIREVTPLGVTPSRCVQVDSASSLYLAGRSFIPTHNSFLAATLAAWWVDTHDPAETMVVTTAPSMDQVHAILWEEMRGIHDRSNLPGVVQRTDRWLVDGRLVGMGRKPPDYSESAFQGIHRKYVLVILDEACGIPAWLWTAVETITTGDQCRILAIGNPDDPNSHFRRLCAGAPGWESFKISCFDSPNFTGETVPDQLREVLTTQNWVNDRAAEWGIDNPLYIAKVLGEFPTDHPWSVVRMSDVSTCRIATPRTAEERTPVELGVDVGGGGDETVIRERRGMVAGREWREHSDQPETISRLIMFAIRESGATAVKIDTIGIGNGVVGELRNLRELGAHDAKIYAVNVSERARDATKYFNLRSQLWWECGRLAAEDRAWDLSQMENADQTIAQLLEPRYQHDLKGRVKVELKDEVRKRLGRSPDNADALLLAFYRPVSSSQDYFEALMGRPAA